MSQRASPSDTPLAPAVGSDMFGPHRLNYLYHLLNIDEFILAFFYITERILTKHQTMKGGDRVAKACECPTNLTVSAFGHCNFPFFAACIAEPSEAKPAHSIIERYAVVRYHLLMQGLEIIIESDMIDFSLLEARMCHLIGEITIVGQKYKTGTVFIKPADRLELMIRVGKQLIDGRSIPLATPGANIAGWLMKQDISKLFFC